MKKKQPVVNISARNNSKKRKKHFPIVAIGASAGGLEAVTELLKNLSANTDMAYVYIQHLDPTHESLLGAILSKVTRMKVVEAKNMVHIKPNHFYILPPNKEMVITDGVLKLEPRAARPVIPMPIDHFFTSLAERHKEGAIGIILSGNASDGALGLKAIKMAGGLTFAQDGSAKFPSMPISAVQGGAVDMILSPAEIGHELSRLSKQANTMQSVMEAANEEVQEEDAGIDEELNHILQLLKKSIGADFHHYKKTTVKRRVMRRMILFKLRSLKEYTAYLKEHVDEINILYQDLLINVTSFFRDPDSMEFLKKNVLRNILKAKSANVPIRIWIAACSTGEEAYSIAILLMELIDEKNSNIPIQIFATDLSTAAINKARIAIYSEADLINVSAKRLHRFFTKEEDGYHVSKSIRDLCVFAPHNIFKDPPFSRLDLISCCNLLIYLDSTLQTKLMATFNYALNSNGFLLLGKSETIGASKQLFTQIDKKYKVYSKRKDSPPKSVFEMNHSLPETDRVNTVNITEVIQKTSPANRDLDKSIDKILLSRYVPPSVVINRDMDILQFRGSTGLFLEPSPGKASLNLMKMAKEGLAFELRNAIHKTVKTREPVKKSGIEIRHKKSSHEVGFEIYPFKGENDEQLYLVTFEEDTTSQSGENNTALTKDKKVKQLEQELAASREDMRSIVEEQEAVNEELQSANEEIVSSNEELQSINEELETSKEEVESSNEELITINQELLTRNGQLVESYEYSQAMFDTIREAVLVLDEKLRVKTCNKSFYKIFNVEEEETEGRMVYELGNRQWDIPKLRQLLENLVSGNSEFVGFYVQHQFPHIGEKTMILNAKKIIQKSHGQEVILLAIEDISEHAEAQKLLKEREEWFRNMANESPGLIWVSDKNGLRTFFNKTWLQFTGSTLEEQMGEGWKKSVHPLDLNSFVTAYNAAIEARKDFRKEYRLRRHDGEYRWILSSAKPAYSANGSYIEFLGVCYEIHDQHEMNEELEKRVTERTKALQEANKNLAKSNDELSQFAYVASHDLQEPLRKIITYVELLGDELQNPEKGKEILKRIANSSKRMRNLIDALLNFSRTVKVEKDFTTLNLADSLKSALTDLDLLISEKKVQIITGDLPVIQAIPIQMKQLFYNLVNNAIKFSRENIPPIINIKSRLLSPEELKARTGLDKSLPYSEITIKDNGIGFEQQYADQIFVIFQRLNMKDNAVGTGIGLALCQKIVGNHGGEIYAEGNPDEGATFHIILPVKPKG